MTTMNLKGLCRRGKFSLKQNTIVMSFLSFLIILTFFFVYFTPERQRTNESLQHRRKLLSNLSNKTQRQLDVVLSYFSEDRTYVARFIEQLKNVSNLQKLRPKFIVYNKNSRIDDEVLRVELNVDVVQTLPNIGREGATYLQHIINNYETISDHTIFCQAGVEGMTNGHLSSWLFDRLERQFNKSVGFMPLVSNSMITSYSCDRYRSGHFARLTELWAMLEHSICPHEGYAIAYRGQFLVSRHRIRMRTRDVYQYLFDLITANQTHWLHREIQSLFFKSTPDNPIFGHLIERIWTILFRCSKPNLYERCRKNECACFDDLSIN